MSSYLGHAIVIAVLEFELNQSLLLRYFLLSVIVLIVTTCIKPIQGGRLAEVWFLYLCFF